MNISAQSGTASHPAQPLRSSLDLAVMLDFTRRHFRLLSGAASVSALLAGAYLSVAPAEYTSTALVMVEGRRANLPGSDTIIGDTLFGNAFVETRAELLRSDRIPLALQSSGALEEKDAPGLWGAFGAVTAALGFEAAPATDEDKKHAQVEALQRKLDIRRMGATNLLQISFRSTDRNKSAEVANAMASAFIEDQLATRSMGDKRTSQWLDLRVAEMREKAQAAETAVQVFKAENNMVGSGSGLLIEQQMSEVSTQLVRQRAQTAELLAKLTSLERINGTDIAEAVSAFTLKDETITELEKQFNQISKRATEISDRLGPGHPAVTNLLAEKTLVEKAIRVEWQRAAASSRNDYEMSQTREQALESALAGHVAEIKKANQDKAKLSELESSARTFRVLHDKLLERLASISEQPEYPVSEAQVVSVAYPPLQKSHPRSLFILTASLLLGLGCGVLTAFIRDQLRPTD